MRTGFTEDEMDDEGKDMVEAMVARGVVTRNRDGTLEFTEYGRAMVDRMIHEQPQLYAKIFPDRLH